MRECALQGKVHAGLDSIEKRRYKELTRAVGMVESECSTAVMEKEKVEAQDTKTPTPPPESPAHHHHHHHHRPVSWAAEDGQHPKPAILPPSHANLARLYVVSY